MMLLSGDPPRSRILSVILIAIVIALVAVPIFLPGAKAMNVAAKICIFAALVASYDLLLGYTGTVSFAHTMFYGIGSYAIAIALYGLGASWSSVAVGLAIGLPLAALLASRWWTLRGQRSQARTTGSMHENREISRSPAGHW